MANGMAACAMCGKGLNKAAGGSLSGESVVQGQRFSAK